VAEVTELLLEGVPPFRPLTGIEQADDRRLRGWLSVGQACAEQDGAEDEQGPDDPGERARRAL